MLTGLDKLARTPSLLARLRSSRVGLLAHPASVDGGLRHASDVLSSLGVEPTIFFGPEHGYGGEAQDMVGVENAADPRTGAPIVSLYGGDFDSLSPTRDQLARCQVLVVDLADVGSRYYTFVWTALLALRAAAEAGVHVVVLDRPNPLGQDPAATEGDLPEVLSFVGLEPVPVRHGLTVGETLALFAARDGLPLGPDGALSIVPCEGLSPGDDALAWDRPFVQTSPNMPTFDTALVYPGGCLIEGTNLSEGRGTTRPFELVGAPFLDGRALARALASSGFPGFVARPLTFTPMFHKHAGKVCGGVQIHVLDRRAFRPYATYLSLIGHAARLAPGAFQLRTERYEFVDDKPAIDLLTGHARFRERLAAGDDPDRIARDEAAPAPRWAESQERARMAARGACYECEGLPVPFFRAQPDATARARTSAESFLEEPMTGGAGKNGGEGASGEGREPAWRGSIERELWSIIDSLPIILFAVDREGRITVSEGHGLASLGLKPGQQIDQSIFELYAAHPRGLDALRRAIAGEVVHATITLQGRTFELRVRPLRDEQGRPDGAVGVAVDITPQAVTQQALVEQRENFKQLIETMPDAVAVVRGGTLVYANPAMARSLGYDSSDELLGRPLNELVAPEAVPAGSALAPRGASSFDQRRFLLRNGSTRIVEVSRRPIDYEGAPAELLVARDVTERTNIQARLLQAERMASLGTLAAGVAHEINNPLTYVSLNLGFVGRELSSLARALAPQDPAPSERLSARLLELRGAAERATEALRIAREGVERVALIVRDLRTFARADEEWRGPIDVRRVLDSSIGVAWNEIRHRARLVKEYGDVEMVEANEAQLGQVFLNLLMNAVQALPEGEATSNEIRVVVSQQPGSRVVIEVRDTGMGIPPAIIDRVFDPFFTTKPVGVSTGLGLSLCHGIVSAMGGEITVESTPGKGTCFRVALPSFMQAPAEAPASARPSAPHPTPRARALIIDDEPLVTASLKQALEPDVEVVAVTSGRQAIDLLLRDQRFDIVLCDLMMPDIAGMDVYEAVRKARPGVEERFVLMTGGAFTHRARDFLKAVPNRCVDKPIDADEIRRLVLEGRRRT